jgi:hypothetical protein
MTTEQQNAERLETDESMDPSEALKQVGKIANSTSDVILKYVMIGVLTLFGFLFFFQWKQNSASPDRVIGLLESQITTLTASLKVQETSLEKIREFAIQVPMEHRDMSTKQAATEAAVARIDAKQDDLSSAVKSNTDAIRANTEAVARLIGVIETRITQGTDPNVRQPPN